MATAEVFPFAEVGTAGAYPDWLRGLRCENGVYLLLGVRGHPFLMEAER